MRLEMVLGPVGRSGKMADLQPEMQTIVRRPDSPGNQIFLRKSIRSGTCGGVVGVLGRVHSPVGLGQKFFGIRSVFRDKRRRPR